MVRATHADDILLEDLIQGIEEGTLGLPNFQRDFDWTDQDVRALLGTVLSGWPIGSLLLIEVDPATKDFYQPRPFEAAPPLGDTVELVTLDGQQRLTALYQALTGAGRTRYAIRLVDHQGLSDVDELDAAIVAVDRDIWERRYASIGAQWSERCIPLTALRSASDFFAWRDSAVSPGTSDFELLTRVYREVVSGLHAYRIPGVVVDRKTPPQAVARIFERVNKHGRTLGAFDLVVARSFSGRFNLRTAWEEALERFPEVRDFQKDDGLPVLAALALRQQEDVRQAAVLNLRADAIRDGWELAAAHYASAIRFLSSDLGVMVPDWLPYKQILTVLTALSFDQDLSAYGAPLRQWFWATGLDQRYWAASNTRAVADYRALRDGDPLDIRPILWDRMIVQSSTRQQQGALHKSILCLLADHLSTVGTIGTYSGLYERSVFSRSSDGPEPPLHLRTMGFVLESSHAQLDLSDQFVPPDWQDLNPELVLHLRTSDLAHHIAMKFGLRVELLEDDDPVMWSGV